MNCISQDHLPIIEAPMVPWYDPKSKPQSVLPVIWYCRTRFPEFVRCQDLQVSACLRDVPDTEIRESD